MQGEIIGHATDVVGDKPHPVIPLKDGKALFVIAIGLLYVVLIGDDLFGRDQGKAGAERMHPRSLSTE